MVRALAHLLILRPLLRLVFGVAVEGREHLVGLEQYIIVANHNSHLDALLLFCLLPRRHLSRTHPVAAADYFAAKPLVYRLVSYLLRPIWITRGDAEGRPLEQIAAKLARGDNVIIFPEGTRGAPGEIARFRSGVGRLAEAFRHVPIVPVLLCGPEKAFPKSRALPLPIYNRLLVGPPQSFAGGGTEITSELERLIREIAESQTARRHRRVRPPRRSQAVAVLGIDGSGKSTVSRALARELSADSRVCLVSDRLEFYEKQARKETQPLLTERARQHLGRRAKTARSLKAYKLPKLAELLLRDHLMGQLDRWHASEIIVLDGSPLINLVAWARLYKKQGLDRRTCEAVIKVLTGQGSDVPGDDPVFEQVPELSAMKRLGLARLRLPDVALMLDVDPAVSMARIESRGEARQTHETEHKLAELRQGYIQVCEVVRRAFGVATRLLDGRKSLEQVTAAALEFVRASREGEVVVDQRPR